LHHEDIFGRAGADDIGKDLQAEVLLTAKESGDVWRAFGEWGVEHVAFGEKVMHPFTTVHGEHDLADEVPATGLGLLRGLLSLADVFAIGAVVGHGALAKIEVPCRASQ